MSSATIPLTDTALIPLTKAQTAAAGLHAIHERYLVRLLRETDVLLNVATDGLADETLSARWGRWAAMNPTDRLESAQHEFGQFACHFLDLFQHDHDAKAVAGDAAHAALVVRTEQASGLINQAG